MVTLRDYQTDCLKAILDHYQAGIRRQIVCLPTGSGKTVIFSEFPRYFRMKRQMLVLAHRSELLEQARNKIKQANPDLNVDIEQADRVASPDSHVVVASVPTLGRKDTERIKRLDADNFYLIVVDEAHHATAATYVRTLEYFGAFAEDSKKLVVGFTATPKRGDGQGLDAVFDEIVFSRTLPEMIHAGYLSPVAGYRVETDIDLSGVKIRLGDFVTSQLSEAVNIDARNELVVDVYIEHLNGKQTLCFCVDVAHAHCLADAFNAKQIPSAAITGEMEKEKRVDVLEDFRGGKINVLTNCMVLTEGYDEPSVEGIIIARPTRSSLLYTQMIGRGTRLHPGKKHAAIVDIVDATRDHSLSTLPALFDLSGKFNMEGHTTAEVQRAIEWVEKERPWVPVEQALSLSDLRYRCREVDLFDLQTPEDVQDCSGFAWVKTGAKTYKLPLPDWRSITVLPTIMGNWEAVLRGPGQSSIIAKEKNAHQTIMASDKYVKRHMPKHITLITRNTLWRNQPATSKQLAVLKARKIGVPHGLTKGQASRLIGLLPNTY